MRSNGSSWTRSIAFDLHERPKPWIVLVSKAGDAAILIEIAVGVARIFAVGEQRRIVGGAIERTFGRDREAVELLGDADGLPDVEVDRQLRDAELGVGAARIVGVDDAAQLQIDRVSRVTSMRPSTLEFMYGTLSDGTRSCVYCVQEPAMSAVSE